MSLVTRCPACGTTFKVVRDQLRISDGWVRCGRCSEVFDATIELHETSGAAPPPSEAPGEAPAEPAASPPAALVPAAESAAPPEEQAVHVEEAEADFLDDEQELASPATPTNPASSSPPPAPAPALATATATAASASPDPLSLAGILTDEPWPDASTDVKPYVPPYPSLPPFPNIDLNLPSNRPADRAAAPTDGPEAVQAEAPAATAAVDTDDVQLQKALRRARAKSAKIARAKARGEERAARESAPVVLAAAEPEPAPESRRSARPADAADEPPSFWQRITGPRALVVTAVLAALLLVLQVLRHERDLILARQPSLRPVLAALCGLTGCELSALRQIGDITIDGASFAREKSGDGYRLSFTLRNAAAVPLAMPAVELSLLDTQERAVVRRVLTPAEFGAPAVLPPRAQRAASLPLALSGPEAAALPPVAGFHLLAFYP